jgi:tyrosyl-tRNA synthetase
MKAPFQLVAHRAKYYQLLLHTLYKSLNLPLDRIGLSIPIIMIFLHSSQFSSMTEFVLGSSYQYSEAYTRDKFRLCALTSTHDAVKAGAEVVKQVESPLLSSLIYPLMQALDEEYLGVQIQFGGVDQVSYLQSTQY